MARTFLILLAAMVAFAADDPWAKVKELKSGTEIRVYKKGSPQPVLAKMDELNDDNLIIVAKNEQWRFRGTRSTASTPGHPPKGLR